MRRLAGPADLLVVGQGLPPFQRSDLFRHEPIGSLPAVLICPGAHLPLARILLVHQGDSPGEALLATVARLCRGFQAKLIVLSVAGSERVVRRQQQAPRALLAAQGLAADFDSVVGSEVAVAAAGVARWRRCQLVVLGWQPGPSWWRRWWGSPVEQLAEMAGDFAFLALPDAATPGSTSQPVA
jgi:K+-sensing histidine kinase KdpD